MQLQNHAALYVRGNEMKKTIQLMVLSLLSLSTLMTYTAWSKDAIDRLQGHYSHLYKGVMENVPIDEIHLIVLKLSPTTAYIESYIGDIDTAAGIADLQADGSLLYQEYNPREERTDTLADSTVRKKTWPREQQWCEYWVHPTSNGVIFSDPEDEQKARGETPAFGDCMILLKTPAAAAQTGISFSNNERRKIGPAKRKAIQKSYEYQEALKRREEFLKAQQSPETAAPILIKQ
jgi:hypothetical protein